MGVFQGVSLGAAIILGWILGFSVFVFHPGTLDERAAWSFRAMSVLEGLSEGREAGFSLPFTLDLSCQVILCLSQSPSPSRCGCIAYLKTVESKRGATMSLGLVDHHLQIHTVSSLSLTQPTRNWSDRCLSPSWPRSTWREHRFSGCEPRDPMETLHAAPPFTPREVGKGVEFAE